MARMRKLILGIGRSLIGLGSLFLLFGIYQISRMIRYNTPTFRRTVIDHTLDRTIAKEQKLSQYLVDTPHCKIPNIDPFDVSVTQFLSPGAIYVCSKYPSLTYTEGTKLHVNWTAAREFPSHDFGYCNYQVIFRPTVASNHNYFVYLPEVIQFNSSIDVASDFIRVRCFSSVHKLIYTNFHHAIHKKPKIERRCKKAFQNHQQSNSIEESLSVSMIGVDSVSRLNMMRYMPKTRKFLLKNLQAVELVGYNKVADNTFVNIVPMTMGKFLEEIPWNESLSTIPFDQYNFIWKQFSKKGYRTLYAEDAPSIAIFDFLKAGFHKAPGDYFNRHYSLAMNEDEGLWYNSAKCVVDRLETEDILDYTSRFMTMFKDDPYFAFTFVTGLTHDFVKNTAAADYPYLKFLEALDTNGALNNTVLFLFSDHGMRFGHLRETYVGKLEERLPFMFLVFPPWFMNKYPNIMTNLRTNSKRLSTPFDIYETLRGILNFKNSTRNPKVSERGVSLFNEIPLERTCHSAGILPHWCTCAEHRTVPKHDIVVTRVAGYILEQINKSLEKFQTVCENLQLKYVIRASKILPSSKVLRFQKSLNDVINRTVTYGTRAKAYVDYQVQFKSRPGDALFEATVRYSEINNSFKLMGDISRINLYGQQSACISEHTLKKYCYCRTQ